MLSNNYNELKNTNKINETLGVLKATMDLMPKQIDDSIRDKISGILSDAYQIIHSQEEKIRELESKDKIPTKDEIESMSAMLDILNKLDIKTIDKLSSFNKLGEK